MSISMAVLALTIVAMIMLFVGTQTMNSLISTKTKRERSVGMAAGDSGIEKVRAALQARLMDETDGWELSEADLKSLVEEQPNATVLSNAETSDAADMTPVLLDDPQSRFTVREAGTSTVGYWQIYDVIAPRYLDREDTMNLPATNLVVYIRAWATGTDSNTITTAPRVFRVEYRPSYISDYQSVTDAPFFVKDNATFNIDGPVHSNGYTTVDWLAMVGASTTKGIYFENAPTCTPNAAFTTSQNAPIAVPGASCATARANAKRHARQISLLGVQDTYEHINSRCGTALVACFNTGGPYNVQLGNQSVSVNGTPVPLQVGFDSGSAAILLDGDVRIIGALQMPNNLAGRVTIATRRRSTADRQPQVVLAANGGIVGAATPAKDSVGVVTQGDVVLEIPANLASCSRAYNLAVISQSGSVTIPPEFVTLAPPAIELAGRDCDLAPGQQTSFYGSFSAHGQFISSLKWPDVRNGGMTDAVGYTSPLLQYNRNLFLNPPPFFPIALPWALTKVKDADRKCLVAPLAGDPRCE